MLWASTVTLRACCLRYATSSFRPSKADDVIHTLSKPLSLRDRVFEISICIKPLTALLTLLSNASPWQQLGLQIEHSAKGLIQIRALAQIMHYALPRTV